MKHSLRVGLTGGIGSGKSLALRTFKRLGAMAIDTDALAHELIQKGKPAYRKIISIFGRKILDARGNIDRRKLGDLVFLNPALRRSLERATHPGIVQEMERRMKAAPKAGVVVADVPLLFEGGHQKRFDLTVLVCAPERLRAQRIARRDKMSPMQIRRRLSAQWPLSRKEKLADIVIDNNGTKKKIIAGIREYQKAFALIAGVNN